MICALFHKGPRNGTRVIYVLSYRGEPVTASYRFERLNMAAADYTREQQAELAIKEVDIVV